MKNFKQIAFGLLVGAMALGFSAFTSASKNAIKVTKDAKGRLLFTASYYNKTGIAGDSNAADFVYRNTAGPSCASNPSDECTAEWTTSNAPVNNAAPSGSPSRTGSATTGDYNGH
ncbi:hypothetical protein BDD43_3059 [Mucilaginibacter gracilis]|uniref:Uncharacterized protein n=1 Tax=Mucilaginibacter gracilis TaxID=423350 RepID=A0A495J3B8_9SPHI|nr:hypothetical protein [Mucilaginibacter gracilis]RKR82868.1 hypothetical protein BDD43_3059 [Mucilaginibacter gracilis]